MAFIIKANELKGMDPSTLFFFIWLINRANKRKTQVKGRVLRRGDLDWDINNEMLQLQWKGDPEREVIMSLKKLEHEGFIDVVESPEYTTSSLCPKAFEPKEIQPEVIDPSTTEGAAMEVFLFHRKMHPNMRQSPNKQSSEWKRLTNLIKKGYTAGELMAACLGNAKNKWWRDRKMHSLGMVLREDHLDNFIQLGSKKSFADSWSEGGATVFDVE